MSLGYRYQFITLAGFHALNASMFELARGYAETGMTAYVDSRTRSSPSRRTGIPPPGTSVRSAPGTSTW